MIIYVFIPAFFFRVHQLLSVFCTLLRYPGFIYQVLSGLLFYVLFHSFTLSVFHLTLGNIRLSELCPNITFNCLHLFYLNLSNLM